MVVADDALHRGLVTPTSLAAAVGRPGRRRGTAAALRVLAFADGRAESPGESRSRVAMMPAGQPAPVLRVALHPADGVAPGRVDSWWPERGVVGEFDGLVRYGRLLRPGQTAGDGVFVEKVREDALREVTRGVVRSTWSEIRPSDAVDRRIRRALRPV